jgi:hypothetical protein
MVDLSFQDGFGSSRLLNTPTKDTNVSSELYGMVMWLSDLVLTSYINQVGSFVQKWFIGYPGFIIFPPRETRKSGVDPSQRPYNPWIGPWFWGCGSPTPPPPATCQNSTCTPCLHLFFNWLTRGPVISVFRLDIVFGLVRILCRYLAPLPLLMST